jgi:hypothetical protein
VAEFEKIIKQQTIGCLMIQVVRMDPDASDSSGDSYVSEKEWKRSVNDKQDPLRNQDLPEEIHLLRDGTKKKKKPLQKKKKQPQQCNDLPEQVHLLQNTAEDNCNDLPEEVHLLQNGRATNGRAVPPPPPSTQDIQIGDMMKLQRLKSKPELNGYVIKVLTEPDEDTGMYEVLLLMDQVTFLIARDKLRHI